MDTIVFFVRSFNDIDHLTPIIDYICKENKQKVIILFNRSSYDFEKNHNIQYLNRLYGLSVEPLWGGSNASLIEAIMCRLIDVLEYFNKFNIFLKKYLPRVVIIKVKLVGFLYKKLPDSWKARFFDELNPAVIVFDMGNAALPHNRVIVEEANKRDIPTICVPHGLVIYTNKYQTPKKVLVSESKDLYFDYYLFAGAHRQYLLDRGIKNKSIIEVGSSRYCREWMDIYRSKIVTEKFCYKEDSEKLKVVLFLSPHIYNVNNNELEKTIELLASMPEIDFVIKPHTRGMTIEYLKTITKGKDINICDEVSSVVLCDWLDVGIVYGSSIALQVVYAGGLLIYPSYIDTNSVHYADNASWVINSVQELKDAIVKVSKDKKYRPYTEEGVKELFNRIVYAGVYGRDVRQDILEYMVKFSREKNPVKLSNTAEYKAN